MNTQNKKITELLKPSIEALGFEWWGCVYQNEQGRNILRVFMESPNGVSVDDCARASRQISSLLDVENIINTSYVLEVSSPGLERILFEPAQFEKYIGKKITVKLEQAVNQRKQLTGIVTEVLTDQELKLQVDDVIHVIPFNNIQKAQVLFSMKDKEKK